MHHQWMTRAAAVLLITLFCRCDNQIDEPVFDSGTADVSRYLAVGNSISSGFSANGMTRTSQAHSFPALIAAQFEQVGSGPFKQPTMPGNGSGILELTAIGTDGCGNMAPETAYSTPDPDWQTDISAFRPYNNLAIPYMSIAASTQAGYAQNTLTNLGAAFAKRLMPDADEPNTYFDFVSKTANDINPTFFTFWLGNNDVLSYSATGGGYLPLATAPGALCPPALTAPFLQPTDTAAFRQTYARFLDTLTANGAKGAVATIPDIPALPFFATIPLTVVNPSNCSSQLPIYITLTDGTVRPPRPAISSCSPPKPSSADPIRLAAR